MDLEPSVVIVFTRGRYRGAWWYCV